MQKDIENLERSLSELLNFRRELINRYESRHLHEAEFSKFEATLNEVNGSIEACEELINTGKEILNKKREEEIFELKALQIEQESWESLKRIQHLKFTLYKSLHGPIEPETFVSKLRKFFRDLALPHK